MNIKFISYIILISFTVILFSIFSYISYSNTYFINSDLYSYYFSNSEFFWPVPGFNTISSPFGKRTSPTTGSSIYHSGIDIPASEGSTVYSVISGTITFIGFNGANGYSILQENENISVVYGHVSPDYIVSVGDFIHNGKRISNIGPKYIYNMKDNPYKDTNGIPTNGATTGPHLHLTIKKDGIAVNPLLCFFSTPDI